MKPNSQHENPCKPDTLAYKILELKKAGRLQDGLTTGQIAKILNREKSSVRYALKAIKKCTGLEICEPGLIPSRKKNNQSKLHADVEVCKLCDWWKPLNSYSPNDCFCSFFLLNHRARPRENGVCKAFKRSGNQ